MSKGTAAVEVKVDEQPEDRFNVLLIQAAFIIAAKERNLELLLQAANARCDILAPISYT